MQSTYFSKEHLKDKTFGNGQSIQLVILNKLAIHIKMNEVGHYCCKIHKNYLKRNKRPKHKSRKHETPKGRHRLSLSLGKPK